MKSISWRIAVIFILSLLFVTCKQFNESEVNKSESKNTRKASRYAIRLENYENSQYIGKVYIGSQKMSALFSTASNLTWMPAAECINCRNNTSGATINKFDYKNSDEVKKLAEYTEYKYTMGRVKGEIISSSVRLPMGIQSEQESPFSLHDFKLLLVTEESESLKDLRSDGVVGLGMGESNDKNAKYSNFIIDLYKQGLISAPYFSFYFSSSKFVDSILYIGDFSYNTPISTLYKRMNYLKVDNKKLNQWGCELNSIEILKKNIPVFSKILIDTGSSYLTIPVSDYKYIEKYLIDVNNIVCTRSETNQLLCECDSPSIFSSTMNLFLGLENNRYEINFSDLIDFNLEKNKDSASKYKCRFRIIIDINNLDTWILGTAAMKNTFFSFNMGNDKFGFIQNYRNIENLINQPFIVREVVEEPQSKIGYMFVFAFLCLMMYGLYKCANNEKFVFNFRRSDSLNTNEPEDRKKIELIKNRFNTDEYDYDLNLNSYKGGYVEMKEIPQVKQEEIEIKPK